MLKDTAILKKQGQIKTMIMPDNWNELKAEKRTATDYLKEYSPADRPEVKLSFYYRGHRMPAGGSEDFVKVLSLPDHELSHDEFESVDLVIRNASDPDFFSLSSCRTETISGKRVLILEGIWLKSGQVDMGIFIDSDLTGSAVQEIHYQASQQDYPDFVETVESALQSIVWM